jgi:hypothetical protein
MIRLAIMQPYFLPYIGYFQLMNSVNIFVVYDDIKFTKKSWIRRNRFLMNSKDYLFSLPLKNDSDYLDIVNRQLFENYRQEAEKILRKIEVAYKKAPYFNKVFPIIKDSFLYKDSNLFNFIYHSLCNIKSYLNIRSDLLISSKIGVTERLKGEQRVLTICKYLKANHYINTIGGIELYNRERFAKEGIKLSFIKTGKIIYKQFENEFVPNLSILDVMMFNNINKITEMLNNYTLV